MSRKRGSIENPNWNTDENNNDLQNVPSEQEKQEEDFLQQFLKEKKAREQIDNSSSDRTMQPQTDAKPLSDTNVEKSIWEMAMEQLENEEIEHEEE